MEPHLPASETFLINAAEKVEVLPSMARATYVVTSGAGPQNDLRGAGRGLRIQV